MQPNGQLPNPYAPQPFGPNPYVQQMQQPRVPIMRPERDKPIGLIISLTLAVIFLLGAIGFGFWAYTNMQDYKYNSDEKVTTAVETAREEVSARKDAEFVEAEKKPTRLYSGPATYGSINFSYPKTWSAFVTDQNSGTTIDGYFHPGVVPGLQSGTGFALRLQVVSSNYANEVSKWQGQVKSGKVKVSAYKAPLMQSVTGTRVEGEIQSKLQGVLVLLPLRDKTIEISTLSKDQFAGDFDSIVLPSFSFEP
jgi:hypothetical protein